MKKLILMAAGLLIAGAAMGQPRNPNNNIASTNVAALSGAITNLYAGRVETTNIANAAAASVTNSARLNRVGLSVNLGGTTNVDWSLGEFFYLTLTNNALIAFTNVNQGWAVKVKVFGATNPYAITWPGGIGWVTNTAPVQTTNWDVYTFVAIGGATNGMYQQNFPW